MKDTMNTGSVTRYEDKNDGLLRAAAEKAVHFLLGILVCRGLIFQSLAPFGCSYVAAAPRKQLFWATMGASLGYIILKPDDAFRYVAVTVAIALVRWVTSDIKLINKSPLLTPILTFLPIFASGIVMTLVSTSTLTDFSMVAVEAVIAGTVAYFTERSLFLVSTRRRLNSFSQSELAGLVMTGCVLMLSVGSIELEEISVGRILAVLIIMLCARYGSVTGGAIAGASLGSVFGISAQSFAFVCGGYSFGGLMGGLFAPWGKAGVALSFVICNAVMSLSSSDSRAILPMLAESLIGGGVFMILPKDLGKYITPLFLPKENSKSEQALRSSVVMRLDFAGGALKNVSGCVDNVSRQLKKLYAPETEDIYDSAASRVCRSCGLRAYCWDKHKSTTKGDFARLSAPLRTQGFVTENDVDTLFSKKCCRQIEIADSVTKSYRDYLNGIEASRRVTQIRRVVSGQFSGLAEILGDLAAEFENYKSCDPDCGARITEYLSNMGFVPMECGCMIDLNGRMTVEIQLARGKQAISAKTLTKDISSICGRCFDTPLITEVGTHRRIVLSEVPVFDVEVGVYQHIYNNGKLCGDCTSCFSNGFGEFVALISDGMGTGGRAAVDSNMTVSILTRLLKAGINRDCALQVVNSALMVKSEDESLATVDLTSIDLFTGKVSISKAGAPFTYIKKNGRVLRKTAPSLPVGILGDVKFSKESIGLSGGDVILMVSDGALCEDEKWLERLLGDFCRERCSDLAKAVVEGALSRRGDSHDDDITAVAVRLTESA